QSYWRTIRLPPLATNIDRYPCGVRHEAFCCVKASTSVPVVGAETARMRPFGLVAVGFAWRSTRRVAFREAKHDRRYDAGDHEKAHRPNENSAPKICN